MDKRQLAQVWANRQLPERAARVGKLASELLDSGPVREVSRLSRLRQTIARGTDEEFRRRCTLGSAGRGRLTIQVDQESLVQPMRIRWLTPLQALLKAECRDFHFERIDFVAGRGELGFEESAATSSEDSSECSGDGPGSTAPEC